MGSGRSDILAGKASVELATDDSKLIRGLQAGLARLRTFASDAGAIFDQVGAIGRRVALFGAGATTGLVAIAKSFADTGAEMAKLQKQTGLSAKSLSGLSRAAADNDVPFEGVRKGLTALQKATSNGGAAVEEAFARIGTTLEDFRKLSPDAGIAQIANGLSRITNEADRTATATDLLGKSGANLLPIFKDGAAGLDAAFAAAAAAGEAFTDKMLAAADKLNDAFDKLAGSMKGFRNVLGEALAPAVGPLVDALGNAVQRVTAWTEKNPELARGILGLTVGMTALGAGVWGVATAFGGAAVAAGVFAAILSTVALPVVLIGTLLLAIPVLIIEVLAYLAVAALAVTDVLGITKTGFGDLFNSIRVGGQGLGTWLGKLWTFIGQGWEQLSFGISSGFDFVWTAAKLVARGIYDAFALTIELLSALFESFFGGLADTFQLVFGVVASTVKSIVKTIGGVLSVLSAVAAKKLDEAEAKATGQSKTFSDRQAERRKERDAAIEKLRARRAELDKKDPNDGGSFSFDAARAKKGLLGIGSSITGAVKSVLDSILPNQKVRKEDRFKGDKLVGTFVGAGFNAGARAGGPLAAAGLAMAMGGAASTVLRVVEALKVQPKAETKTESEDQAKKNVDVGAEEPERAQVEALGTFNADMANRLGFGSTLDQRRTKAAEATATNTGGILDALRSIAAWLSAGHTPGLPAGALAGLGALVSALQAAPQSRDVLGSVEASQGAATEVTAPGNILADSLKSALAGMAHEMPKAERAGAGPPEMRDALGLGIGFRGKLSNLDTLLAQLSPLEPGLTGSQPSGRASFLAGLPRAVDDSIRAVDAPRTFNPFSGSRGDGSIDGSLARAVEAIAANTGATARSTKELLSEFRLREDTYGP